MRYFILSVLLMGCVPTKTPSFQRGFVSPSFRGICQGVAKASNLSYEIIKGECFIKYPSGNYSLIFGETESYVVQAAFNLKANVLSRPSFERCLERERCLKGHILNQIACHRACALLTGYKLYY